MILIHSEQSITDIPETMRFLNPRDALQYNAGVIFKQNRFRCVRQISTASGNFFLKQYTTVPLTKNIFSTLFPHPEKSEAFREFHNIKLLHRLGIKTMQAMLVGEENGFFIPERSFLVTREIRSHGRLEDYMQSESFKTNFYERRLIIKTLADYTARLHKNYYFHKDLYLGHFLIHITDPKHFDLFMIDLQRIQKHRFRGYHFKIKDLASLHFSIPPGTLSTKDQAYFLKCYLAHWNEKINKNTFLIRQILKKSLKIKSHTQKKQLRKSKKARSQ